VQESGRPLVAIERSSMVRGGANGTRTSRGPATTARSGYPDRCAGRPAGRPEGGVMPTLRHRVRAGWTKVQRFDLYTWILQHLIPFLLIVLGVPLLAWLVGGWNLVPVVQLVLVAIAAVPPIAKWWRESVDRLIENKPVVFSERCPDGTYELRNVGGGLAVNVWYFSKATDPGVPLGSLSAGDARPHPVTPLPPRHLLIAEARPGPRKWTLVMNVLVDGVVCHGFTPKPLEKLDHKGTLTEFLYEERDALNALLSWQPRN
jgi:hypothetical protein